jgi:DNA-directed RNA polymerase beta subunit
VNHRTGLPEIGISLREGDIVFAKYKIEEEIVVVGFGTEARQENRRQIINKSISIDVGKDGIVKEIHEMISNKKKVYRITVASTKTIEPGDKLASRYSQKGVVDSIVPHRQIPVIIRGRNKGMRPDVIFSPMSLTSRATPGLILELFLGIYAAATGQVIDATAFKTRMEDLIGYNEKLREMGFSDFGMEEYYDPVSGETYKLMTGICLLRVLKHTAVDKQKACGPINHTTDKQTRQPSKGNVNGSIKNSYMDFFTLCAHSATNLMHQFMCDQSDRVVVDLCANCGHLCDRCNRDIATAKDRRASRECAKCHANNIIATKVAYGAVAMHMNQLAVGAKLSLFPSIR